jgi:hypothetical protein
MFTFFFLVNRRDLITFCGSIIEVGFDPNGVSGKECFRLYEDGYYKGGKSIITKHPNIVKSVLIGKKGWGLWVDQWTEGIVDWSLTKEEILKEFEIRGIEIPDSFLKDFHNTIERKKRIRNLKYLEELKMNKEK